MSQISIIVPVYQVKKYISQCIESIVAQTFTDFELILVDDGSTDNSGQICDEYAAKDERIKVIHQKNSGAAAARNSGLDAACSDYFMFVDGDDYLAPEMLERLYNAILAENADIAACNYRYVFENDEKKDFTTENKAEVLCGNDIYYYRKNERNFGFWTVAWNKLYKAETFKKVRFRFGKYYEDEFWANDIYQMNIKVVTVSDCLYYYRQHCDNTMKKKSIDKCFDILDAFQNRIYVYLNEQTYSQQAYKVLIYSLEHLSESKRLIADGEDRKRFIKANRQTKEIIKRLKKRKLSKAQKISLLPIGISPCFAFDFGIKFRKVLEKIL